MPDEMNVLQNDPMPLFARHFQGVLRNDLLALPEGDAVELARLGCVAQFLSQAFHLFQRIDARGENEEDRNGFRRLFVSASEIRRATLDVLLAQLLPDEQSTRR